MKIERFRGTEVKIETLNYGDTFLIGGNLYVKINDSRPFPNAVLNLDTNEPDSYENDRMVTPVKAKVTYEYI